MDAPSPEDLREWVEQLGNRDWRTAGVADRALAAAGSGGIDAVLEGLSHPDGRIRQACAGFLDHRADDRCVELLGRLARFDPIPSVRRVALHSLTCDRCKPVPLRTERISILIERALAEPIKRVRIEAIYGLGMHPRDPRAADAVRTVLANESDPRVRAAAESALQLQDPDYRRAYNERVREASMAAHRARAASARDGAEAEVRPAE